MRNEHQITGIIELPLENPFDEFWDKFIVFLENEGGTFGGMFCKVDEDGEVTP